MPSQEERLRLAFEHLSDLLRLGHLSYVQITRAANGIGIPTSDFRARFRAYCARNGIADPGGVLVDAVSRREAKFAEGIRWNALIASLRHLGLTETESGEIAQHVMNPAVFHEGGKSTVRRVIREHIEPRDQLLPRETFLPVKRRPSFLRRRPPRG